MASLNNLFPLCLLLLSFHVFSATCTDFMVGGDDGWSVPQPKEADKYNKWASENRFQIDDTVHFKYKKDSVMVVTEEEYKNCRSPQPIFFGNNGDTVVKIDRAGLFYFISGVSGHCEKGQKMIIKTLEPLGSSDSSNGTNTTTTTDNNGAAGTVSAGSSVFGILLLFTSLFFF